MTIIGQSIFLFYEKATINIKNLKKRESRKSYFKSFNLFKLSSTYILECAVFKSNLVECGQHKLKVLLAKTSQIKFF